MHARLVVVVFVVVSRRAHLSPHVDLRQSRQRECLWTRCGAREELSGKQSEIVRLEGDMTKASEDLKAVVSASGGDYDPNLLFSVPANHEEIARLRAEWPGRSAGCSEQRTDVCRSHLGSRCILAV